MVYMTISKEKENLLVKCNINKPDGEYFDFIIDANSGELIKYPEVDDIDSHVAVGKIKRLIKDGYEIPNTLTANWG